MKVLRIFLQPDASQFIDMGAGEPFNMMLWWMAVKKDGAVISERGLIKLDAVHHVVLLDGEPVTPNLFTVLPGGKPN
jgi:hypothetical protein